MADSAQGNSEGVLQQLRGSGTLVSVMLLILGTATVLIVLLTHWLLDSDRARMHAEFSEQRREHIDVVAREVAENLNDILHDLQFALPLLSVSRGDAERRRILETLVSSEAGYGAAVIVHDGPPVWAYDARSVTPTSEVKQRMLETTQAVFANTDARSLDTSNTVADGSNHSLRVFAMRFNREGQPMALGLLVDIESFLEPLRLVSSDPQNHLLVLGPRGLPSPASDPKLVAALDGGTELSDMVTRMRGRKSGTMQIHATSDGLRGLGDANFIAAYAPITSRGDLDWSVATLTSLSRLREHERQAMWRLYTVAFLIVAMILSFGAYVLTSIRRRAVLQERLRTTWQIAHLNEKADKILHALPAGVLVVSHDNRITDVNHPMGSLKEQDVLGRSLHDVFPDDEADEDSRRLHELVRTARQNKARDSMVADGAMLSRDGHFNIHVVPLEFGAPDTDLLLVFENITALRELEGRLLRAEKLATIGELSAGIAHEIGTPLGVARGRAELVADGLDASNPSRSDAKIVIDQIDNVRRIMEGLLDYSRASSPVIEPVDLGDAVANAVELLRYELGARGVEIEVEVPPDLPPVAADADQLRQVLVNLLMNARDASEEGDRIVVAGELDDDAVLIAIHDQGRGMPAAVRGRMFEPFFTTKKRGQGTGLGLWVVMQILREHDAEVDVSSNERGTRVTVRWPLMDAASSPSRRSAR